MNETKLTLEKLPTELNNDQFYCFVKRNGKIMIGNFIGNSALSKRSLYLINGVNYSTYTDGFPTEKTTTLIQGFIKCYKNYQDFLKDYQEYLKNKEKEKIKNPSIKKYIVSKSMFNCEETRKKYIASNYKTFYNKEAALKYANNGIKKLKKQIETYIIQLNKLKEEVDKTYIPLDNYLELEKLIVKPTTLKLNDILIKIDYKKYKHFTFPEIINESTVLVKEFITPYVIKLSDGTLLLEIEYKLCPGFVKYEMINEVKTKLKKIAIKRIKKEIEQSLENLERGKKYCEQYIPFNSNTHEVKINFWFSHEYIKELIEATYEYLNKKDEE